MQCWRGYRTGGIGVESGDAVLEGIMEMELLAIQILKTLLDLKAIDQQKAHMDIKAMVLQHCLPQKKEEQWGLQPCQRTITSIDFWIILI